MKDVVWLSLTDAPPRFYWDQQLLEDIFVTKTHHTEIGDLKEAIVVIPTSSQDPLEINKELAKLDKCIVICTSDEWHKFDIAKINHPNMKLYSMYAYDTKANVTWLPIGYTPHSKTQGYTDKDIDILFAGQVNHKDRKDMVDAIKNVEGVELDLSPGFAQGHKPKDYIKKMQRAKVVPSPKGNISPDAFRTYEALEHGAVPIGQSTEFYNKVFGSVPFPVVDAKGEWPNACRVARDLYPTLNNVCSAWWQRYKCDLYNEFNDSDITFVVPVSPIKSHPSTEILDETIKSIRHQSDGEIIITFDGVREEQEDMRAVYELFINNVLSSGYTRIRPIIFDEQTHQVGMMREAMKHTKTPYIVYVEQDTPFTDDYIDWQGCMDSLDQVDLIRFHFEASIPKVHEYLMLGKVDAAVPLIRTKQYSQRPHITTKEFYEKMLSNFSPEANTFIEDKMHSVCQEFPDEYKLAIYHPEGSIKRSYHLDGRAGEVKFDDRLIF